MVTKKMMTKSLICMGLVTLMAQSTAMANTTQPTTTTGFYGGVALGAAALTGDNKVTLGQVLPPAVVQPYDLNVSSKNIEGDLFVGYGKRFNCFWVAIEVIGSLMSLNTKDTLTLENSRDSTLTTSTTNAWGGSINLGYHINPTSKLYVKLGIESRRFKTNFTNAPNAFVNFNKAYNSTAFVPGFGMETELTPRLSLRTEYRIALHGKKTAQTTNSAVADNFTNIQTKPTIHYFNVGFVVKI